MDSLNLKTLLEVVRTGSFSKAANNLFVTQSAVSRRIKFLEDDYGHPLLDRSGVIVKPTPAGRLVLAKAKKILALEESLLRQLERAEQSPRINFACTRPFGIIHLPNILKRYMKNYDLNEFNVTFEMPANALRGLDEERYELIVVEHWERLDLARSRKLSLPNDEMVFVSSPQLGLPTPWVTIDDLVRQRLYRRKAQCCSWTYLALNMKLAGRDITEFGNIVIYDDLHVIVQSLLDGDGIAFICKDLVQQHLLEGRLCEHRIEGFSHGRERSLLVGESVRSHPAITDFIECVCLALGTPTTDIGSLFR